MESAEIFKHVDHTYLSACATWADIEKLCGEAARYKTASVCIPPAYVKWVSEKYGDTLTICTVIGFPLGYNTTESKVTELKNAERNGAVEFDMVVNLGDIKNGDFHKVESEIAALRKAVGSKILKVIVETCYLTEQEKIELCKIVTKTGANYIKTPTGFGTGGATLEDVEFFKKYIGPNVKIKASGGIRSVKEFEAFLALGVDRLGTSSAVKVLVNPDAGAGS
jgi:deoxyribose-phosphate aldolase